MVAWYLRLARRRPGPALLLLLAGAVLASAAAYALLGARGALVPELLYMVFGLAVVGFFAIHFLRAARKTGFDSGTGKVLFAFAMLPTAFALFIAWQALLLAGDLVLPFEEVETRVVAWHYHYAGRGPGSLHLRTEDGVDHAMPSFSFYSGPRREGWYQLEVTRFEGLVVEARPIDRSQ